MECIKCKKNLPDDSKFCAYCGTKFKPINTTSGSNEIMKGAGIGAAAALGGVFMGNMMGNNAAHASNINQGIDTNNNLNSETTSMEDFTAIDYGIESNEMDVLSAFDNLTGDGPSDLMADTASDIVSNDGVADVLTDIFDI